MKAIHPHQSAPADGSAGLFCTLCGAYSVAHRLHEWDIEWVDMSAKGGTDSAKALICSNCYDERSALKHLHETEQE